MRKSGNSYLVDQSNKVMAISFSTYVTKNKLDKKTAEEKRRNILNYLQTHKDEKFFIKLANGEIYLTPEGENFVNICKHALSKPRVTSKASKVTVEKLDTGVTKDDDYIERAERWIADLASMSSHSEQPFSTNKCFVNPYGEKDGKRVFIDLYREVNGIHEGYIILGKKGTLNAMQSVLIDSCAYAAMRKKYGDNIRLYVIAQSFEEKAIDYVRYNLFNVECKTLLKLGEELVLQARKYYEEADATYKMKDWGKRYESIIAGSIPNFSATFSTNSFSSSSACLADTSSSNIFTFSSKAS